MGWHWQVHLRSNRGRRVISVGAMGLLLLWSKEGTSEQSLGIGTYRNLGEPYFGVLKIRILPFRLRSWSPLFSEAPQLSLIYIYIYIYSPWFQCPLSFRPARLTEPTRTFEIRDSRCHGEEGGLVNEGWGFGSRGLGFRISGLGFRIFCLGLRGSRLLGIIL